MSVLDINNPGLWAVRTKIPETWINSHEGGWVSGGLFLPNPILPQSLNHYLLALNLAPGCLWMGRYDISGSTAYYRGFGTKLVKATATVPNDPLAWNDAQFDIVEDVIDVSQLIESKIKFRMKLHLHFSYSRIPEGQQPGDTAIIMVPNPALAAPPAVYAGAAINLAKWNAIPADGKPYFRTFNLPALTVVNQNDRQGSFGDFSIVRGVSSSGPEYTATSREFHPIQVYGLRVTGPYPVLPPSRSTSSTGRRRAHFTS